MAMTVNRNKTVWQRIQEALEPSEGRAEADRLATLLLPVVVAERRDAEKGLVAGAFPQYFAPNPPVTTNRFISTSRTNRTNRTDGES